MRASFLELPFHHRGISFVCVCARVCVRVWLRVYVYPAAGGGAPCVGVAAPARWLSLSQPL